MHFIHKYPRQRAAENGGGFDKVHPVLPEIGLRFAWSHSNTKDIASFYRIARLLPATSKAALAAVRRHSAHCQPQTTASGAPRKVDADVAGCVLDAPEACYNLDETLFFKDSAWHKTPMSPAAIS
jgi:hypothetical protein